MTSAPAREQPRFGTVATAAPRLSHAPLGWLPLLAATTAIGLLLVAVADALNRSMASGAETLFWVGLVLIYAPVVARLAHVAPLRGERTALVVLMGLALYLVKVFRDPFGFTFADELVHAPNANAIERTHHLYHANPILHATPSYPGLESVTAALASLSGLTTYGAGLIVIGVARLLIVVALFLLIERISGSARAAGLGVAIYAANANFAFFSAQFSYESLALPLMVVALFAYSAWRDASHADRAAYRGVLLLLIAAIVTTHHLTSYGFIVILTTTGIAYFFFGARYESPIRYAAFAFALTVAWLLVVASSTVPYLFPVFKSALTSVVHTVSGEGAPRQLFGSRSGSGASGSGLIGRVVALGGVAVLAMLYPPGALEVWRKHRRDPFVVLLAVAGGAVFVTYLLRFVPGAWETANRSSEFLFIGLAVVLPLGALRLSSRVGALPFSVGIAALLTVAFTGGVIAGWTPSLRLSQPYRIVAGGTAIPAEGRSMASWAASTLGSGRRYAATDADARLLNTYAAGWARAGQNPDVIDILRGEHLDPWMVKVLNDYRIRFVVVDRRVRSFDNTAGYYFDFRSGPQRSERLPAAAVGKFTRYNRIFDGGDIVIFDRGSR